MLKGLIKRIRNYYRTPEPGDIYFFPVKNPFESGHRVKVISVLDGYVKYEHIPRIGDHIPPPTFREDSAKLSNFRFSYRFERHDQPGNPYSGADLIMDSLKDFAESAIPKDRINYDFIESMRAYLKEEIPWEAPK